MAGNQDLARLPHPLARGARTLNDATSMPEPDASLLARARKGDASAVEALLASVAPSIHRFGLRMCKDPHSAEDVLQDTLLTLATHLGDFEGRSSLLSWVFTLARTACARRRRGLKNKPMASDTELRHTRDTAATPEEQAADRELGSALARALDDLPDEFREVIALRDIEGLSAAEAAAALSISVDAVKSRLHRAREALRSALRPLLEGEAPKPAASCPDVIALWSKKLEGDLSASDCAAMEGHIKACASCNIACDALKRALVACRRSATTNVTPEVQTQVKAAMRAWQEQLHT